MSIAFRKDTPHLQKCRQV